MNSVEVFDPHRNQWNDAAPMIEARNQLATVVVDGKIYAVGKKINLQVKGLH